MLLGMALLAASPTVSQPPPRLAILAEPGFPYYMADEIYSPRSVQDLLQQTGLEADLLRVHQLGDPAAFSADRYAAYVHVYGNTFPLEAFDNLVAFHRAGGSLILTSGVPFCHPVVGQGAASWAFEVPAPSGRALGVAHAGQAALRICNTPADGWTGPASRRFPVTPGERYTVGGWAKVERDLPSHEKSALYLRFFNGEGQFIGQSGPPLPHQAGDWTRLASSVTVPANAATADVSPQLWAPDGELLIDDLYLHRGDDRATNLLGNPSFEEPGGSWRDLGHDSRYQEHDGGIGCGGFLTVEDPGAFAPAPFGETIGLGALPWSVLPSPSLVQTLAAATLPKEDVVRPLLTLGDPNKGVYPSAMIVHRCGQFNGAVDVWCRSHCMEITGRPFYQVVLKSTVAALREKGRLTDGQAARMAARVDEVMKPEIADRAPVTEPRPYPTVWPQSKHPSETLLVCDASRESPQGEFALTVLQGLVNREQPRLYLIHTRYAKQDRQWLDELKLEGIKAEPIEAAAVWERFGQVPKGVVLYDPAVMGEIGAYEAGQLNVTNLVLMLCAVHDAVPLAVPAGEAPSPGRNVLFDTRGRWGTPGAMYRWAYDNLWPRMNHHILGTLYPGIFYLTDYLVQHRIFTFWFDTRRTFQEQELLEQILASTPPNTPIIGWWFCWMPNVQDPQHAAADCVGEGEGVRLGSTYGKFLTPSHECTNLSVHSGMPLLDYKHQPPANPQTLDRSKVYFSFVLSDGDNLGECLMMRCRELHWDAPERGRVPIGWSFAPASAVLAPPVRNYYLRTATANDCLVGGLGIAYTQPDAYLAAYPKHRDALYAEYARLTADALAPLDTGALWLIGGSRENVSRYAAAGAPLKAIFPDYGSGGRRPYEKVTYADRNDVSVFRAVTGWGGNEPYPERLVREIREATEGVRPAFAHVFLLNWGTRVPMLEEVVSKLGSDYVCVRPDELDRLFRESRH